MFHSSRPLSQLVKLRFEAFGCAGQASRIKAVSLEDMAQRYR